MTLSDGFEINFNKWGTRNKLLLNAHSTKHGIKMKKKFFLNNRFGQRAECETTFILKFENKKFMKTGVLEDMKIRVEIVSKNKRCEIDLVGYFGFNTYDRSVKSRNYISVSMAITLFEFLLIFFMVRQLEANDYLCSSQSVFYWTLNSAFSCLFCFVNVFFSVENFTNIFYFLILASLHFFNFSMLILRLLYRIGRNHLTNLMHENPNAVSLLTPDSCLHSKIHSKILPQNLLFSSYGTYFWLSVFQRARSYDLV